MQVIRLLELTQEIGYDVSDVIHMECPWGFPLTIAPVYYCFYQLMLIRDNVNSVLSDYMSTKMKQKKKTTYP